MNKNIKLSIFALLIVLLAGSCDIKRFPKDSLVLENGLESVTDLQRWDNSANAYFRGRFGSIYRTVNEYQADMLFAGVDFGNRGGEFFYWTPLQTGTYEFKDIWHAYYSAIKNLNKMINSQEVLKPTKEEQATFNACIGDAYFFRAFYYYELAKRYSKAYNPSSVASDLCVPITLEYDIAALPKRSTVKEVFEQITSDLAAASKFLAGVKGQLQSDVPTIDACAALEARVKLYMQDWAGAAAAAKKLTTSGTYKLADPTPEAFEKMWRADNSPEDILLLYIEKPNELPNGNGSYIGPDLDEKKDKVCAPDWYPAKWVIDMYEDVDLRKNVYFEQFTVKGNNQKTPNIWLVTKFMGNPKYADVTNHESWGVVPNGILRPKVFRLSEMYLILAEASYKAGNEAEAKTALNALRASRGLAAVSTSGDALFKDIQAERTRELAYEGERFFDLKRWGMKMHRHGAQTSASGETPFLVSIDNALNFTIEPNNFRWVWPVPYADMQTNPNLKGQQNPGWENK